MELSPGGRDTCVRFEKPGRRTSVGSAALGLLDGLRVDEGRGVLPSGHNSRIDGTVLEETTSPRRQEEEQQQGAPGLLGAAAPCLLPP